MTFAEVEAKVREACEAEDVLARAEEGGAFAGLSPDEARERAIEIVDARARGLVVYRTSLRTSRLSWGVIAIAEANYDRRTE